MAETAGISFSGLASGLDTSKIVDTLLKVDQARIDSLTQQRAAINTQVSAVGTFKSKLQTLQTSLDALRFQSQLLTHSFSTDVGTGQAAAVTGSADSTAVPGSFKVWVDKVATPTKLQGASGISNQAFDPDAAFSAAGLSTTPTAGKFTIDGVTIDATGLTTINQVVGAINAQQNTVTAELIDVNGNVVNNAAGNPVALRLRNSTAAIAPASPAPILVGSAGDTSNFLSAMKVSAASQNGEAIDSTTTLGRLNTNSALQNARLATPLAPANGSFTVNGVSFTYNAATDTLSSMISKINSSTANVSAFYDAVSDRLVMTSKATGAQAIALSDTAGNFLAAVGATTPGPAGAQQTLGANALYHIDTVAGGAQQSSTSNTVTGVVPGVTLNLQQVNLTPVTVTIGQDTGKPLQAVKDFLTAFNDLQDFVKTSTRFDANGKKGVLQGDLGVRMIGESLRSMISSVVPGLTGPYSSLADVGISSGSVGSAVGTTNSIVVNDTKFAAALAANPNAVSDVLNSTNGIFQKMRTYVFNATLPSGMVSAVSSNQQASQKDLDKRIEAGGRKLDLKRTRLQAQFARMESAVAQLQAQGQRMQSQLGQA